MSKPEMKEHITHARADARISIFRRIAVERYSQPLEADMPEMLARLPWGLPALALVLLCVSAALLLWA